MHHEKPAILVLEDGKVFKGFAVGVGEDTDKEAIGEVVFNTAMSGYQEILTDPSYTGQMITFTYPHIGNVGTNSQDIESDKVHATGLIVKDIARNPSNYRSEKSLPQYLKDNNILGISGIDTRELVLHLRTHGSKIGIISTRTNNISDLVDKAKTAPNMEGLDLVPNVTCKKAYDWKEGAWCGLQADGKSYYTSYSDQVLSTRPLVVAIDFGIKYNILRLLTEIGFRVKVVPANTSATEIMSYKPDALFLSNGPGDPAAVTYGIETTKNLLGKLPIFGICLGHQILGIALGAPTFKLKFGHRGGNHPVKNQITGHVEISVQNHGFATKAETIPKDIIVTHLNLNDNTIEGIDAPDLNAFSVQYHPECSPGPSDSQYLFKDFYNRVVNN